ncbi:MAG: hypothetical protein O2868_18245 [Proteobacteria bacterium]|nr:hypothetical protein [Pseudomonadota bacterium]
MNPIQITYRVVRHETVEEIVLELHPETLDLLSQPNELPPWTALDYHKCPHCPLDSTDHEHCPAAVSLVDIVNRFNNVASHDGVAVEIVTSDRTMFRETTSQKAVGSLFGLLMATSGCPHTSFLKPMARFHLPLATQEETIYRVTGMYLLAQYFLRREGKESDDDLAGLRLLYDNLHTVNVGIASRIRQWTKDDSSVNAIAILDVFSSMVPFAIEDELVRIERLFSPYLTEFYDDTILSQLNDESQPVRE